MSSDNVLVTIPARVGSKGVIGKNTKLLKGIQLYRHPVLLALHKNYQFIVTTDNPDIYNRLSDEFGYYYYSDLHTDVSLAWDIWQDAVKAAEIYFNKTWDIHLYLEPTSPCRTEADIERCIELIKEGHDSVCTMSKAPVPEKFIRIDEGGVYCMDYEGFMNNKPRQLYENNWLMKNGICYACTDKRMKEATSMLDPATHFYLIKRKVVNIDCEEDFLFAEALLK